MKLSLDALKAKGISTDVLNKITGGNKLLCHPGLPTNSPPRDNTTVR